MKKKHIAIVTILLIALGTAGIAWGITTQLSNTAELASSTLPTTTESISPTQIAQNTAATQLATEDLLLYLTEEEKLAHDVYSVMLDTWGINIFDNISRSETQHQNLVLGLLDSYGIQDPRSTEIGVFINPDLQNLYDTLIAQGMTSKQDAFQVGVIIEETDIADLTEAISTTTDPTILQTLDTLLKASQNHLAAFTKQI